MREHLSLSLDRETELLRWKLASWRQHHRAPAVLVAVDLIDGRKGTDSLARLCCGKLAEDPFSAEVANGAPKTGAVTARHPWSWRLAGTAGRSRRGALRPEPLLTPAARR
ncbi:MAG: hypothetical protein AB1758_13990 [Candidatus Eremiobacterota bacterium]